MWRRPRELIVLLLMPFILITILGSALGAFNDGDIKVDAKLAVLLKDDPKQAQEKVIKEIQHAALSEEEKTQKIAMISAFNPVDIFLNEVIETKELKKVLKVTVVEKGLSLKEQKKYDGILEIPASFSEQFYQKLINEKGTEGTEGKWKLAVADNTSVNATVIQDIVASFQKEMNLAKTAQQLQVDYGKIASSQTKVSAIENLTKKKEIDAFSYYAVGMCVMFVFYMGTTVADFAYQQKEEHIYERILLANVSPFAYFAGIFAAAFFLSFIQLNVLFGLTALVYGVTFPNIMYYLCITIALNGMTASFSVFITAISYVTNSRNVESIFSSLIVPILAFAGGSFFDLSSIGGFMERIGEISPGGAALTAYLKVIQGFSLYDMTEQFQAIFLFTGVLLLASMMLVGKRGAAR